VFLDQFGKKIWDLSFFASFIFISVHLFHGRYEFFMVDLGKRKITF